MKKSAGAQKTKTNNEKIKIGDLVKIIPHIGCKCAECVETKRIQHTPYGFISPIAMVYRIDKDYFKGRSFYPPARDCYVLIGVFYNSHFGYFGKQFLEKI